MFKEILVPYLTSLDEPSVNLVRPGYREKYAHTKIASDIYKELEDFKGKPNKSYMLVVAVSPDEYWGPNKNHDGFTEYWLKKRHHTFVEKGTFFKNHVNKDPSKNYGDNERSWYDDEMKRVLVLVGVDHDKAPDIVDELERGKKISVSMGTKIPYDVCSICGNKAPTRAEYCDHAKYHLGEIYPDGRRVYVDNPDPTFFDLSKVVRPAGHIEYMIKKVIPKEIENEEEHKKERDESTSEKTSSLWLPSKKIYSFSKAASESDVNKVAEETEYSSKLARLSKLCTMIKVIKGDAVTPEEMGDNLKSIVENSTKIINPTEDLDNDTLDNLSKSPLKKIFSTSNLLGIRFKIPELVKIILNRLHMPDVEELFKSLETVDFEPGDFIKNPLEGLKDHPTVFKIIIQSKITDGDLKDVDSKVAELLVPWMEKRSSYRPFLEKRAYGGTGQGGLDIIPAFDAEGNSYLTTREALDRTSEANAIRTIGKGLGLAGALGATSYATMKLPIIGGKYLLPASIFGTVLGAKKLNDMMDDSSLMTIPSNVPLQKISQLIDKDDKDIFLKVAYDDQELLNSYIPLMTNPTWGERVWDWAQRNPGWATLAGLTTTGLGLKGLSGVGSKVRQLFTTPKSSTVKAMEEYAERTLGKTPVDQANFIKGGPTYNKLVELTRGASDQMGY